MPPNHNATNLSYATLPARHEGRRRQDLDRVCQGSSRFHR